MLLQYLRYLLRDQYPPETLFAVLMSKSRAIIAFPTLLSCQGPRPSFLFISVHYLQRTNNSYDTSGTTPVASMYIDQPA